MRPDGSPQARGRAQTAERGARSAPGAKRRPGVPRQLAIRVHPCPSVVPSNLLAGDLCESVSICGSVWVDRHWLPCAASDPPRRSAFRRRQGTQELRANPRHPLPRPAVPENFPRPGHPGVGARVVEPGRERPLDARRMRARQLRSARLHPLRAFRHFPHHRIGFPNSAPSSRIPPLSVSRMCARRIRCRKGMQSRICPGRMRSAQLFVWKSRAG
jgi:hypothetical protein